MTNRLLVLTLAVSSAGIAKADSIPVFSTGSGGSTDAYYTITAAPAPIYLGAAQVITTPDTAFPFFGGPTESWADNALNPGGYPTSAWIGPVADVSTPPANVGPGLFTYTTTFDMTGLNVATATISGIVAADNGVDVYFNGNLVTGFHYEDFSAYTDDRFPTQSFAITSGYLQGLNTLEFRVTNEGPGNSPTGLRVALSGTAAPVPEPVSLTVAAAGACAVMAVRQRRRQQRHPLH